jgi:peptidoglycan/xylan/chitin deacetylase (PgdA/CDA1 family)
VDGPVYTSIYNNLIGIQLHDPDVYSEFQSNLAVYHDDYGDYSTNEPTMDGTASLIYLLAAKQGENPKGLLVDRGAIIRADVKQKNVALVFTGDEFFEGLPAITKTLRRYKIKGGFFFTGRLYENRKAKKLIMDLVSDGHYMGPHSEQHLLYNDWAERDSLLVTRDSLINDLRMNYEKMSAYNIDHDRKLFIPPYEWWNEEVVKWCNDEGIQVVSFTPGTATNADYTYEEMGGSYSSSENILKRLFERNLNGSIILVHAGTDPRRKDKLYDRLPEMIAKLRANGYNFVRIDELVSRF